MDKKNTTIGVLLLVAAFAVFFYAQKFAPRPSAPPPAPAPPASAANPEAPVVAAPGRTGPEPAVVLPAAAPTLQQVVSLRNDFVEVSFTDFGGAVNDVAFFKYPAVKGQPAPYVFNQLHYAPILAFMSQPGLDAATRWQVVEKGAGRVVFRAVADGKLEVTRSYTLPQTKADGDPYRLQISTTLRNVSAEPIGAQRIALNLGTAAPVGPADTGFYLNVGFWNGDSAEYVGRSDLQGGGFFARIFGGDTAPKPLIEKQGRVIWGAVKNQFFAAILTLDQPGVGLAVRRVKLETELPDTVPSAFGLTGDVLLDLPRLEPAASVTLGGRLYVGPKEYPRLKEFDQREEKVMQFDQYFFNRIFLSGFFAPLLLMLLDVAYRHVYSNWGVAIILVTFVMRTVFLPLNLTAAKSAKRMSKIQPRLKEINEKYADNPQKKQKATLELFKEAKVNPLGGCLPILITMPFFVGFYAILQSSSELRFAEFLWIQDLAAPDTVARVFGLPINIMPILMGITQIVQMQLVPTPAVDNAQAKMLKFMPYGFVLICYNFGSGLALYWTISNLFTIGQQLLVNRMRDDPTPALVAASMKNVTPPKSKKK